MQSILDYITDDSSNTDHSYKDDLKAALDKSINVDLLKSLITYLEFDSELKNKLDQCLEREKTTTTTGTNSTNPTNQVNAEEVMRARTDGDRVAESIANESSQGEIARDGENKIKQFLFRYLTPTVVVGTAAATTAAATVANYFHEGGMNANSANDGRTTSASPNANAGKPNSTGASANGNPTSTGASASASDREIAIPRKSEVSGKIMVPEGTLAKKLPAGPIAKSIPNFQSPTKLMTEEIITHEISMRKFLNCLLSIQSAKTKSDFNEKWEKLLAQLSEEERSSITSSKKLKQKIMANYYGNELFNENKELFTLPDLNLIVQKYVDRQLNDLKTRLGRMQTLSIDPVIQRYTNQRTDGNDIEEDAFIEAIMGLDLNDNSLNGGSLTKVNNGDKVNNGAVVGACHNTN